MHQCPGRLEGSSCPPRSLIRTGPSRPLRTRVFRLPTLHRTRMDYDDYATPSPHCPGFSGFADGSPLLRLAAATLGAQTPAPRIQAEISSSATSPLQGSLHPAGAGRSLTPAACLPIPRFNGITLVFNRSAAQQADLDALLAAQQNPGSPHLHQWLTPDQFAARFGMASVRHSDKVQTWLQQQGFSDRFGRPQPEHDSLLRHRRPGRAGLPDPDALLHRRTATSTSLRQRRCLCPPRSPRVVSAVRNLDDFRPTLHDSAATTARGAPIPPSPRAYQAASSSPPATSRSPMT